MPTSGYLIDSSLLVLLVAGRLNRQVVARHRRLREFSVRDYDTLRDAIRNAGNTVFCTPNTLTEASNHLRQCSEPWRTQLSEKLAELINESKEIIVLSSDAIQHSSYARLGLADASSLQACDADRPLLTVDLLLFNEAVQQTPGAAVYFDAIRQTVTS